MSDGLGNEVLDLGKAIGLFDDGGNLQPHWFENPLTSIEAIFTTDSQRAAFLRVLDALLPPIQSPDIPANETWHPLLGDQTQGNAYITVNTANGVTMGFAGDFHSTDGPPPLASLQAHLPLVSFSGGNVTAVAGTAQGPLDVNLRIHLGFHYGTEPIGLDSVIVKASLAPLGGTPAALTVSLEGLQLDASGPNNVLLDPANLGPEATHLVVGFIQEQLSRLAGPTGEAAAVANNLLQLLGFGDGTIPQFPFTQLSNPAALNNWFGSLLQGGSSAPVVTWLGHLVGLLGAGAVTVTGTGTEIDPWVAPILNFGSATGSGLNITMASKTVSSTTSLLIGLQARVIPGGATPPVRIEGNAILASVPITGAGSSAVLPSAAVIAHAPGALGAGALVSTSNITVQSLRAGFNWTGAALQPLLELDAVDFQLAGTTTHYNKVDLTNADSVASDVSSLIGSTIAGYLGTTGPGRNLAALIGMVPPKTIQPRLTILTRRNLFRTLREPSLLFIVRSCSTPRTAGRTCSRRLAVWLELLPPPRAPAPAAIRGCSVLHHHQHSTLRLPHGTTRRAALPLIRRSFEWVCAPRSRKRHLISIGSPNCWPSTCRSLQLEPFH